MQTLQSGMNIYEKPSEPNSVKKTNSLWGALNLISAQENQKPTKLSKIYVKEKITMPNSHRKATL